MRRFKVLTRIKNFRYLPENNRSTHTPAGDSRFNLIEFLITKSDKSNLHYRINYIVIA